MDKQNAIGQLLRLLDGKLRSILKNETLKVKVEDNEKIEDLLKSIDKTLSRLSVEINGLSNEGPSIDLNVNSDDTVTKFNNKLEEVVSSIKDVYGYLDKVSSLLDKISQKEMVVNVPKFPEIKFPKVQQVSGKVKFENKLDLSEIKNKLDEVVKAINAIYIPAQKEIKIPEVKIPSFPTKIELNDGKLILKELKDLKKAINSIKFDVPEFEFPNSISVDNFPIPKYPNPVTNININPLRGSAYTTSVTVTTDATPLPETSLSYRRALVIYNNSSSTVYVGGSEVTVDNGFPIPANSFSPGFDAGPRLTVYGIVSTGTANVRVLELSNEDIGG